MHRDFIRQLLQEHYQVGQVYRVEPFYGGLQNFTAKVETGEGFYTVKLYTKGREELSRIGSTLLVLERVAALGLRVNSLVRTRDGEVLVRLKQSQFHHAAAVLTYLEGEVLLEEEVEATHIRQANQYLAILHRAFGKIERGDLSLPAASAMRERVAKLSGLVESCLSANHLALDEAELKELDRAWRQAQPKLAKLETIEFRQDQLVHTDFTRVNLLFKNDKLSGVLDFDACRFGDYREDLGVSVWMWFEHQKQGWGVLDVEDMVLEKYKQTFEARSGIDSETIGRLALLHAWHKMTWYLEKPRNPGEKYYHEQSYWNLREPLLQSTEQIL